MKENYAMPAQERTLTGKGGARKVRAAGLCPAVLYGPNFESRSLQIDPKLLQRLLSSSGENTLLDLEIAESENRPAESLKVIIRSLDYHPLGLVPAHVDFYKVNLEQKLKISIPVELVGTCEDVERKTAILSQHIHELPVECLPDDIPSTLELDISGLEIGRSLHVSDLTAPSGVSFLESQDATIASLNAMKEEVEEEEAAPELESAEPEVIGEPKEEGESASSS